MSATYSSSIPLGVYVKDIIANLTARGILNRGKPFARNTVYNILKNEKYSGIYRHGDEVFENMYPQIVPQEIFDRVRSKITANKYGKRSVEVVYLLRHKLKCGYCGQPISAEIEIFFHKPTRNSPDESRGCFVYKGRKENFDIEIWIV